MSSVDNRIVNMQFNSSQFTKGAADSQKALQNLESSLAKAGNAKGLTDMGSAVDRVSARFSALQVVGVTALATIASKGVAAAGNFLKGFSGMQSAMDGFQEYELKMGSIQTIMANTGENLKTVNARLNELNEYSDKTIYNFGDMTKNIGLFTNAGIGLADATAMIKGFSNEAAVSGTTSANAAGAAYQLSQALSAGTIRLMDWRSLTNVGMGNAKMKEGIIEIADAMGVFEGKAEVAQLASDDFNSSLEHKWLSAEVMTNYLKMQAGELSKEQMRNIGLTDVQIEKFMKQQKVAENAATKVRTWTQLVGTIKEQLGSGWAQTAELIIGDFHQATKLFTTINNSVGGILDKMTKSRNEMFKEWADEGGRTMLFDSLGRVATSIGSIFKTLAEAFRDVFPPSSENRVLQITQLFEKFSKAIVPSESTLDNLRNVFSGLFSVLKLVGGVVGGVIYGVSQLFGILFSGSGSARGGILSLLGSVGQIITAFQEWLTQGEQVRDFFGALGSTVGSVLQPVIAIVSDIGKAFAVLATGGGKIGFADSIDSLKVSFASLLDSIFGGLAKITAPFEGVSAFFSDLQSKLEAFQATMTDISSPFEQGTERIDAFKASVAGSTSIMSAHTQASEGIRDGFSKLGDVADRTREGVSGLYEKIRGESEVTAEVATATMASAADGVGAGWETAQGRMSTASVSISSIFETLGNAVGWLKDQFSSLFGGMDAIEWASLMNALFTGAVILSIKRITNMLEGFSNIGETVIGTFEQLTDTLKAMQNQVKADMILNIGLAIALMTASLIALSFIDTKKLAISLGALAAMMGLLAGTMYLLGKIESEMNMGLIAVSILMISAAMVNMAVAVAILGRQDMETLAKGLGAMAIAMAIMVVSVKALSGVTGKLVAAGAGMILMATAMNILAGAVAMLGNMDMETLKKGLGAIAISMVIMVPPLLALSKNAGGVLAAGAAIVMLSGAMVVMAGAVALFGNMDLGTLAKGIGAIAYILTILTVSILLLSANLGGTLAAATAIAILVGSLNMLIPVILMLGTAPWQVVAQGIGLFAAALGVLLLAGAVAGIPIVTAGLIALGTSVMLMGAGMALAGVGMVAFSAGLLALTAAGVAAVAVIIAAIEAFMALLPTIATQVAAAFVAFLQVIANASGKIRKAFGTIFKNIIGVIRDAIPEITALFNDLVGAAIKVLSTNIPKFINLGFKIIDEFLKAADKRAPGIVDTAISLVMKFMDLISKRLPELADKGAKMVIKLIEGISKAIDNNADDLRNAALGLARSLINGLTFGLVDEGMDAIRGAVSRLADAIPGWVKKRLGIASPSKVMYKLGRFTAEGFTAGIKSSIKAAVQAALALADAAISAGNTAVAKAQVEARKAQSKAYAADAKAAIKERQAAKARRDAEKFAKKNPKSKEAIKRRNKAAAKLEREAQKARRRAEDAQKKADSETQKVEDVRAFEEADLVGKGDIKQARSLELAEKASRMLAKANAEAAEARRLMKTNKDAGRKMLQQARKDAARAKKLAEDAQKANADANAFYEQEVEKRLQQLQEDAAFETADTQGKAAIRREQAERLDQQAKDARDARDEALEKAQKAFEEGRAADALRYVAEAEAAAQAAQAAADQAEQLRQEAQDLLNPGGSTTGGSGGIITPSASILEDAASVMDRYTASLQQATEMAAAQQTVVQFEQNNYSPEALSASEIYRQSRNLLSSAEIKMGATTPAP